MTAPAQILANALQCAVDAVCNFARFVVNESRTRLTPPPPPPLGICGSIAAAARIFGLALLLTTSGALAVANDALAQTSCPDFHESARNGNLAGVECNLAIVGGPRNPSAGADGLTPLHHAAGNGHAEIVTVLLAEAGVGPDPRTNPSQNETPLHHAAFTGQEKIVSILLDAGADVNAKNAGQSTPLHFAFRQGNLEVVKHLLREEDVLVNERDSSGFTPLDFAFLVIPEFVPLLIEKGAHYGGSPCAIWETVNPESNTPPCLDGVFVSVAISAGGTISVSWSEDADVQGDEGILPGATVTFTALPDAGYSLSLWGGICDGDSVEDSRCVQEVRMDATVSAVFSCTDLHAAAAAGNLETVNCILASGADVNAPDAEGKTPLHLAAGEGHLEVVQELLTVGATLNAADDDGDTPLTEAADEGHMEIFNLLVAAGGKHAGVECGPSEVPNPNGNTPPCESCGTNEIVSGGVCVSCGADEIVSGGACVSCGANEIVSNGVCVSCGANEVVSGGACVSCGANEIISNGVCESCGRNEVASGGACECASGYEAIGGTCIHPENRLPEDETTCADAFGGDWVDLSAEHGEGKGVCSGIDINDTFCLAGTGSALPCLGLFNHVRSCNLLGRPALDPWHCAAACAGGKASGARCLE